VYPASTRSNEAAKPITPAPTTPTSASVRAMSQSNEIPVDGGLTIIVTWIITHQKRSQR
jgi:hypothetical protein